MSDLGRCQTGRFWLKGVESGVLASRDLMSGADIASLHGAGRDRVASTVTNDAVSDRPA